ncbi:MAG: hypothetical protein H7X97_08500 [Opitutaceae bacterium]|nr:hypothetical protein [Verrucomicrobiales bacterium]
MDPLRLSNPGRFRRVFCVACSGAGLLLQWFSPLLAADRSAVAGFNVDAPALDFDPEFLRSYQTISLAPSPLSPSQFDPDPGALPVRPQAFSEIGVRLEMRPVYTSNPPPQPPIAFNPDPGASQTKIEDPFFAVNFGLFPEFTGDPIPDELQLPRSNLFRMQLVEVTPPAAKQEYGSEPLPGDLKLPRQEVRSNGKRETKFHTPEYPLAKKGEGYPANAGPRPDRWSVVFTPWRRYTGGEVEVPYQQDKPALWHPYQQSLLKGDLPVIGDDIFLNLTAGSVTEMEFRRLPTPSGVSAARPDSAEFYGRSEQFGINQFFSFAVELFKGETVFQPVHWAIKLAPVANLNYIRAKETGVVNPDPRGSGNNDNTPGPGPGDIFDPGSVGDFDPVSGDLAGSRATTRGRANISLQEYFGEIHIGDLSDSYDFIAAKAGNQVFISDFRGFVFNDINLGARIFGNIDNNRYQYNVIAFDMREKDTYSDLNTFDARNQRVVVANLFRQDFLWKGYTAQLSFHANVDEGGTHYDLNDNIVRPSPIGTVEEHAVKAYYFGWAGDGHIGALNVSHAFYQVFGHDELNGLAGQATDISAQMAALELSFDRDWIRYKASFFYASGDHDAENDRATGFDSIIDNPNFTGGPFSYYVRQGFNLGGTAVALKQRNSLLPNLRTSKTQGQASFVNPGVFIYGVGAEIEVTPKLRSFLNANYVRFADTSSLQTALLTTQIREDLGVDLSIGFQYRPLLTDNIILSAGFGAFLPGGGYRDIYRTSTVPVPGYGDTTKAGETDGFLYSGLFSVTFTY